MGSWRRCGGTVGGGGGVEGFGSARSPSPFGFLLVSPLPPLQVWSLSRRKGGGGVRGRAMQWYFVAALLTLLTSSQVWRRLQVLPGDFVPKILVSSGSAWFVCCPLSSAMMLVNSRSALSFLCAFGFFNGRNWLRSWSCISNSRAWCFARDVCIR